MLNSAEVDTEQPVLDWRIKNTSAWAVGEVNGLKITYHWWKPCNDTQHPLPTWGGVVNLSVEGNYHTFKNVKQFLDAFVKDSTVGLLYKSIEHTHNSVRYINYTNTFCYGYDLKEFSVLQDVVEFVEEHFSQVVDALKFSND